MGFAIFFGAAVFEIAGCYFVWQATRTGQPWLWAPALVALALFAWLLTLTGTDSAGRAFAVYGGIYILASLIFMGSVEGVRINQWDIIGASLAIAGAAVIYFAPRAA